MLAFDGLRYVIESREVVSLMNRTEEADQLRKMRVVSQFEGTTLILLVFIAVPLKHLMGLSTATAVMGPIHGIAFVFYIWMLIQTLSSLDFSKADAAWMILAAFVPFGGFLSGRALARRQAFLR